MNMLAALKRFRGIILPLGYLQSRSVLKQRKPQGTPCKTLQRRDDMYVMR